MNEWPFPDIEEPVLAPGIGQVSMDLDGCLAKIVWPTRYVVGEPIPDGLKLLRYYASKGFSICIHTSRGQQDYDTIWNWIRKHNLPVDKVKCDKPIAAVYIDDRAWRFPV